MTVSNASYLKGFYNSTRAMGAKVSHAGKRWINATANSHWEPGVYGWTQQP